MIIALDRETLGRVKNPHFYADANTGVQIYDVVIETIRRTGISVDTQSYREETGQQLARLRRQGAICRNDDKSIFVNRISPACISCREGIGGLTQSISYMCHRKCFYCFVPAIGDYELYRKTKRDYIGRLERFGAGGQAIKHVALTGGEPLLHKADTVSFFKYARTKFPGAYTRLYTAGDLVDPDILKELQDQHLDEIRFSLRLDDPESARRGIFDRIALAKGYVPKVMVEMPVLPGTLAPMKAILLALDGLDIFGINLLELGFPFHNAHEFKSRSYQVKNPPYRVLYPYRYSAVPISKSEPDCLELLDFATREKLGIGVHYCSLENRLSSEVYQQNYVYRDDPVYMFSKKDFFLKSARVYGRDIPGVLAILEAIKTEGYVLDDNSQFLEFHPGNIKALAGLDIEVGITSNIVESDDDHDYIKMLRVDLTYPGCFDLEADV